MAAASTDYFPIRSTGISSDQTTEVGRAIAALGNMPNGYLVYFRHFAEGFNPLTMSLDAGASFSYPGENVLRMDSGATGGEAAVLRWRDLSGGVVLNLFVGGLLLTDKAYVSARMRVPTAPGTDGQCVLGVLNGTEKAVMGFNYAVSAANWSVETLSGNNIDSGVAMDTSFHTHRMWLDGANVTHYKVDDNAEVTQADAWADQDADLSLYALAYNAAHAATKKLDLNWVCCVVPRGS